MSVTVLYVDDSRAMRLAVGKSLKGYDCTVVEAGDGEEGMVVARKERPDVIMLDLRMPVMDGITMLQHLRSDAELKEIPVVMLTAEASMIETDEIAALGVSEYLMKPFAAPELVEKLGRIVALRPRPVA
jgi:CheY-like chemotaxis protein